MGILVVAFWITVGYQLHKHKEILAAKVLKLLNSNEEEVSE